MARLTKKQKAYKRYCKMRYYTILSVYTIYHVVQLGLITYAFKNLYLWSTAIVSATLYHCVKWYQLRHMKFRKRGFYKRR